MAPRQQQKEALRPSRWERFKDRTSITIEGLNNSIPVYVTRKTANGETVQYSQSLWMTLAVQLLVTFNAILWGIYGLIQAAGHIF